MQKSRIYTELERKIRAAGLSATPTSVAVLSLLSESARMFSIDQIISHFQNAEGLVGISTVFTTIYRCLLRLEEAGLIRSIQLADGSSRFQQIRQGPTTQIQHVICEKCSTVETFEYALPREIESFIETKLGYQKTSSFLELRGICRACQKG